MTRKPTGLIHCSWLCLWAFCSSWAANSSWQEWQFSDSANPAPPTASSNCLTAGAIGITVGYLSADWLPDLFGMGTRTGIWDLGMQNSEEPQNDTRGRLDVSVLNPFPASDVGYIDLALTLVQFVDKIIYTGDLTFSLPGGTNSGRKTIETLSGLGGSWVQDEYHWRLDSTATQFSLAITGAVGGTIIDSIRIDAIRVAPQIEDIAITSIRKNDGVLSVSWRGGKPPYEVQIAPNLETNAPWQKVKESLSGTNVEFEVSGPIGFIKVRGNE